MLMDRQRENAASLSLRHGEVPAVVAEGRCRRLEVKGDGVMDLRLDTPTYKVREQLIAAVNEELIEVIDMPYTRRARRNLYLRREIRESLIVERSVANS